MTFKKYSNTSILQVRFSWTVMMTDINILAKHMPEKIKLTKWQILFLKME